MQTPEKQKNTSHEPTAAYYRNLHLGLDRVFTDTQPLLSDGFNTSTIKAWSANGYVFSATETRTNPHLPRGFHGIAKLLGIKVPQLGEQTPNPAGVRTRFDVIRLHMEEDGLYAMRTYDYMNDKLTVANTVAGKEDVHTAFFGALSMEHQFQEAAEGLHTPSELELLDFLADVSSFENADEIIR